MTVKKIGILAGIILAGVLAVSAAVLEYDRRNIDIGECFQDTNPKVPTFVHAMTFQIAIKEPAGSVGMKLVDFVEPKNINELSLLLYLGSSEHIWIDKQLLETFVEVDCPVVTKRSQFLPPQRAGE